MNVKKHNPLSDGIRKNVQPRTVLCLFLVLLAGFACIYLYNYYSSASVFKRDVEHVSTLTSESIYYQIDSYFAGPVNISLTMANDTLLKECLYEEKDSALDRSYTLRVQEYLKAYKAKYDFQSVFLVSTSTGRYYHFNGLDRVLTEDNPENTWYFDFLENDEEYSLNVDNDEAGGDTITVFVNCKVMGSDGHVIGVVGVGMEVVNLQELLKSYDQRFHSQSMLIDENGIIQLSSDASGDKHINLTEMSDYEKITDVIFSSKDERRSFWLSKAGRGEDFVVTQYIPELNWYLLVENDTDSYQHQFEWQLLIGALVSLSMLALILFIVNRVILHYNEQLVRQTVSQELEYQQLLNEANTGLYENVFEMDITHNRAGGEYTRQYFMGLGLKADVSYSDALKAIAEKEIREDFVEKYLALFSPDNVLKAFKSGQDELYYDFMATKDGENYYWLRIRARIFYWASDDSVRMITYRQNIDSEKKREAAMLRKAETDPLTGLYNRTSAENRINDILQGAQDAAATHALMMIDIDRFKEINDTLGHAVGDEVLKHIAAVMKIRFRSTDVCGRLGGDEFIVFLRDIPGREWLEAQAETLLDRFRAPAVIDGQTLTFSASIGIALYPESGGDFTMLYRHADSALYLSKREGRNQFSIYTK